MSDDTTTMRLNARMDQANAELHDTAVRVSAYFKTLVASGIPADMAALMSNAYNTRVLNRHFNVQMFGSGVVFMGEGDE